MTAADPPVTIVLSRAEWSALGLSQIDLGNVHMAYRSRVTGVSPVNRYRLPEDDIGWSLTVRSSDEQVMRGIVQAMLSGNPVPAMRYLYEGSA